MSTPPCAAGAWRSLYGYNPAVLNFTPYNGTGRATIWPTNASATASSFAYDSDLSIPTFNMINYQVFWDPSQTATTVNFVRNPEYYGKVPFTGQLPNSIVGPANFRYVGGANPPWTAYDTNSMFLAQSTAAGGVLLPSFCRPWTYTNANIWADTSAGAKYSTLRPHPTWNPEFVTPDSDGGGDVRNNDMGLGTLSANGSYYNNDSYWMDLGFPILSAPNGQRYKPLFAAKIDDLSNRLHLWANGNRLGTNGTNGSNQGWGPTEVNLTRLLSSTDPLLTQKLAEFQAFFNLKYGGMTGNASSVAAGSHK